MIKHNFTSILMISIVIVTSFSAPNSLAMKRAAPDPDQADRDYALALQLMEQEMYNYEHNHYDHNYNNNNNKPTLQPQEEKIQKDQAKENIDMPKTKYVFSFQAQHDHNGALGQGVDSGLEKYYQELKGYKVIFLDNIADIDTIINVVTDAVLSEKNGLIISHLIIHGHGNSNGIKLGEQTLQMHDNATKNLFEFIKPLLDIEATVLLHGCEVAKGEDSFCKWVSTILAGNVIYGADGEVAMRDLCMNSNLFHYYSDSTKYRLLQFLTFEIVNGKMETDLGATKSDWQKS